MTCWVLSQGVRVSYGLAVGSVKDSTLPSKDGGASQHCQKQGSDKGSFGFKIIMLGGELITGSTKLALSGS